jgi:hypothetical protein
LQIPRIVSVCLSFRNFSIISPLVLHKVY